MIDLMLKLLTYEPYEKVSGNEKDYIDKVLSQVINTKTVNVSTEYVVYDELFRGFLSHVKYSANGIDWNNIKFEDFDWLKKWKSKYYPAQKYIGKNREVYPILFKKICFFWITEGNLSDEVFTRGIGLRPNILNKWQVSPRYRKLINSDTYSSINLYRNGIKQPYLTSAIKAVYYESSRQTADIRYFNPAETAKWIAPKKNQLPKFVDVFAGTGTVAASVGANESVVNDIDVGAACFLYSMSHDSKEVCERLAQLHNNFVSKDLSGGQKLYTVNDWQKHKKNYEQYINNQKFEDVMIRLRNNYVYIHNQYVKATTGVVLNFQNVSANDIEMFYDIGVAWMFINAIKGDSFHGNTFEAFDMGVENYLSYITSVLGIDYRKSKKYASFHSKDDSDAAFLEQYRISRSQIKFSEGKKYMKALSDVEVESEDFRYIMNAHSDGFIYLDSPYFLTTDYQIPFRDEEHKEMLDMLRNSEFDWLFSMQYKDGTENKQAKHESDRKKNQKNGKPIIKNYRQYYEGFVSPFDVVEENGLPYYVAKKPLPDSNKLWVLLFYGHDVQSHGYGEMMICNFDPRRVFPYMEIRDKYLNKNDGVAVLPFEKFLEFLFDGQYHATYGVMLQKALDWRKNNIIEDYASGAWV